MTDEPAFPPCDEPHDWVVFVSQITTDQARDLGAILGSHGFTGTFYDGPYATQIRKYRQLRDEYRKLIGQMEGGDGVGEGEAVHEARS